MSKPKYAIGMLALVCATLGTSLSWAQQGQETSNAPATQQNPVAELPTNLDMLFPLSPEEQIEIRERQLENQEAVFKPLRDVRPIRDIQRISGNADQIPEVFVTPDYPTSIVFTDMTGAPWPINYIGQSASLATIEQPKGTKNSLVLQAKNSAGRKSIAVFLEGLSLPVTLTITGDDSQYHALKHIRITDTGPNANHSFGAGGGRSNRSTQSSAETSTGQNMDLILNKMAYKVTPEGFEKVEANDPRVDAWIDEEDPSTLYVMTDHTIVSPAPRSGARSVTPLQDNVKIYVLPRINPIMALNKQGERIYVSFERSGS